MAGGRFDVALLPQDAPQSFGLEIVELLVAGHAGSTPRPLAKVASGGELSRLALAIAVTTAQRSERAGDSRRTLIFDEIDAGVGGAVADTVGRLMKQLGARAPGAGGDAPGAGGGLRRPPLRRQQGRRRAAARTSDVAAVAGEARVGRGGAHARRRAPVGTSLAHAQELLARAAPRAARGASVAATGRSASCAEHDARRARSCWSPASPARASRWRCTRSRTPATSASTTCRPSCCASSCASSSERSDAPRGGGGGRAQRRLAAAPAAADRRAARRRRAHPLAVPRRQHRRAGAPLLRDAPPAPAVAAPGRPATPTARWSKPSSSSASCWPSCARCRPSSTPASCARPSCAAGCATWSARRGAALTLVFESFAFKHGVPLRRRLRVRRARAAQPVLHPRAAPAHRARRAGGRLPRTRSPRAGDARRRSRRSCARWLPAFEDDQRSYLTVAHRLHRRPAPLGVLRRGAGAALRRRARVTLVRHRELDARNDVNPA